MGKEEEPLTVVCEVSGYLLKPGAVDRIKSSVVDDLANRYVVFTSRGGDWGKRGRKRGGTLVLDGLELGPKEIDALAQVFACAEPKTLEVSETKGDLWALVLANLIHRSMGRNLEVLCVSRSWETASLLPMLFRSTPLINLGSLTLEWASREASLTYALALAHLPPSCKAVELDGPMSDAACEAVERHPLWGVTERVSLRLRDTIDAIHMGRLMRGLSPALETFVLSDVLSDLFSPRHEPHAWVVALSEANWVPKRVELKQCALRAADGPPLSDSLLPRLAAFSLDGCTGASPTFLRRMKIQRPLPLLRDLKIKGGGFYGGFLTRLVSRAPRLQLLDLTCHEPEDLGLLARASEESPWLVQVAFSQPPDLGNRPEWAAARQRLKRSLTANSLRRKSLLLLSMRDGAAGWLAGRDGDHALLTRCLSFVGPR